jgi:hypothetical protein
VIRHVLHIRCAGDACRPVGAGDLHADPVTGAEEVGGGQDLDVVLDDLLRRDESSSSGRSEGTSNSPSRAVRTEGSGPTSFNTTIQLVSS